MRLLNALKARASCQVLVMMDDSRLADDMIPRCSCCRRHRRRRSGVFYAEDRKQTVDGPLDEIMESLRVFGSAMHPEQARQFTRDAMMRKARAAHLAGGRCFGYDNIDVFSD